MKINTKDEYCGFEHTLTSLRFFMTAVKGLPSSGVFRLPGVGATIEVSRIVMALIIRPWVNAIWGGVGGSGRVWAAGDRVCPFPGVVAVKFQLFRAETEFPVTWRSTTQDTSFVERSPLESQGRIVGCYSE